MLFEISYVYYYYSLYIYIYLQYSYICIGYCDIDPRDILQYGTFPLQFPPGVPSSLDQCRLAQAAAEAHQPELQARLGPKSNGSL